MYTSNIEYAGWLSCTVSASTSLGQAVAGLIVRWGGNPRYWIILASFAMVGFVSSLAALTPETKVTGIVLTILGPFWVGFIELTSLALAPLFCKPADIGLASGMLASIRSAGGSIAVAVYTTILTNRLTTTIATNVGSAAVEAGLAESRVAALVAAVKAGTWKKLPDITDAIAAAVKSNIPTAYGQAFKTVYLASLGFGGIAIIGSLFTKNAQKHLTSQGKHILVRKWLSCNFLTVYSRTENAWKVNRWHGAPKCIKDSRGLIVRLSLDPETRVHRSVISVST